MINISKSDFLKFIPNYVIQIAETLQKNGYEAYLVGGCIRDIMLGIEPDDFDIATNAYPEEIVKIFEKSIPTGAKFGTITVVAMDEKGERYDVQVTTYRSEADYFGGRWPSKVEFAKTIQDDLSRRDFTVNSMALNIQKFDENSEDILVDPYEGVKDLESKSIKAVRDPLERLSEDGLRGVRACRLASQLDFKIDPATFEAIKQTLHVTKQVSVERFRDELLKILYRSPKPSKGLRLLKESGILELFIPELLEGIDVTQPEFHTDDVFEHSLKACDIAEDSIKLAALFHDIGKPRTQTIDEKGTHFYSHDVVGAEMVKEIMQRLKFSNAEIERTVRLVRWHMFYYPSADWRKQLRITNDELRDSEDDQFKQANKLTSKQANTPTHGWTDGAVRRLIKNVGGEDAIDDLMKLRIADADSNPKNDFNPIELDELSKRIASVRAKEMALRVADLDITGDDLMKEFSMPADKKIGEVLNYLLELVIDEPLLNKRENLLKLALEYLEKNK
jgi:tRNA nucleotidyltransferase (CCA-adding enzyme)